MLFWKDGTCGVSFRRKAPKREVPQVLHITSPDYYLCQKREVIPFGLSTFDLTPKKHFKETYVDPFSSESIACATVTCFVTNV